MRMKRSINHTGRKKILRDMVQIKLHDGAPPTFTAALNLDKLSLPDSADVYVEAYYAHSMQRFAFGTVGRAVPSADTSITEVDQGGRTSFRVKVVDNSGHVGRLLASAEKINPEGEGDDPAREHLITVIQRDLGQTPWGLDLSEDGFTKPILKLNFLIPDAINQIRHNPTFQALILPAVVREVFAFIFWDCNGAADDGSWQSAWLDLGRRVTGREPPDTDEPGEIREWVDEMLDGFARNHALNDRLVVEMSGDES